MNRRVFIFKCSKCSKELKVLADIGIDACPIYCPFSVQKGSCGGLLKLTIPNEEAAAAILDSLILASGEEV